MPRCKIVDTTLRDGEQAPGYAFSPGDKAFLASLLDQAGVCQIEAGAPIMGGDEKDGVCAVKDACGAALVSTWNRLTKKDVDASLECRPDIIHICLPVSERHIVRKLRTTKTALLRRFREVAEYAAEKGGRVTAGFEDASRADERFLYEAAETARRHGVERIRLSDTVGLLRPSSAAALVRATLEVGLPVEMHAHNDLGMALANSASAVLAGAEFIDATLLGIGERAGNCGFGDFVAAFSEFAMISPEAARKAEGLARPLLSRRRSDFFCLKGISHDQTADYRRPCR
ncbi:MAG: homocitrate synthase [Candidatus Adiutrix sp.]|jgi:homocitrate synthase NifV|nr:homocitrate synthase [Candidatus Adiutrix sp.]